VHYAEVLHHSPRWSVEESLDSYGAEASTNAACAVLLTVLLSPRWQASAGPRCSRGFRCLLDTYQFDVDQGA
jgi:hypothetical protein